MINRKYPRNSIAPIVHLRTKIMAMEDNQLVKFEDEIYKKLSESDGRRRERLKIATTVINSEKRKRGIQ